MAVVWLAVICFGLYVVAAGCGFGVCDVVFVLFWLGLLLISFGAVGYGLRVGFGFVLPLLYFVAGVSFWAVVYIYLCVLQIWVV